MNEFCKRSSSKCGSEKPFIVFQKKYVWKDLCIFVYIHQNTMGALELRNKLIEQFNLFIQDDSKLVTLDGIFDSINTPTEAPSIVPEEHYKIVEERRRKYHARETIGSTWEEVKQELKNKYGF